MTKFENKINSNKKGDAISCIIIGENETFQADIIADNIKDVVDLLPVGYELDLITTLCNYFDAKIINEYEIELNNSQYVYYTDFKVLVSNGLQLYVNYLKKGIFNKTNSMDRLASDKYFKNCI